MKDYVSVIAAVISGLSAIICAFIAWRLKEASDDKREAANSLKERHAETKLLYETTFLLFERAIREIVSREPFTLADEFCQNNARMHLLAPEHIIEKYSESASLLESWSTLHAKASPRQWKIENATVTIFQAPDPTIQYKEPAKIEHDKFQTTLQELITLMRTELKH
ncbi:hypothetical protein [Paraburkholderia sacchari]|uniref:hypothetical protein n=1 Tax=Paraburkholderia sacchari TaxID=159450 RepID=UPI003D98355A